LTSLVRQICVISAIYKLPYPHNFCSNVIFTPFTLISITQAMCKSFFIRLFGIYRHLCRFFVFDKLPPYDVISHGNNPYFFQKMPTVMIHIHTKSQVNRFSGTVFFYVIKCISKSNWPLNVHQKKECTVHIYSST